MHDAARRKRPQELGVSEAAISSHTAALRKELDDPLYYRRTGGLAFTPGGLRLASRAVELLGLQDQTRQEVLAAGSGQRILRLATTSLFAEFAAPGMIELFKTRADDLEVEMSVHQSNRFAELLTTRQADVTIAPFRQPPETLRTREFLKYQLVLVVGTHPRLAERCEPTALRSHTWLLGPSAVEPHGVTARSRVASKCPRSNNAYFKAIALRSARPRLEAGSR